MRSCPSLLLLLFLPATAAATTKKDINGYKRWEIPSSSSSSDQVDILDAKLGLLVVSHAYGGRVFSRMLEASSHLQSPPPSPTWHQFAITTAICPPYTHVAWSGGGVPPIAVLSGPCSGEGDALRITTPTGTTVLLPINEGTSPIVKYDGGRIYALNKQRDTIRVYNSEQRFRLEKSIQLVPAAAAADSGDGPIADFYVQNSTIFYMTANGRYRLFDGQAEEEELDSQPPGGGRIQTYYVFNNSNNINSVPLYSLLLLCCLIFVIIT